MIELRANDERFTSKIQIGTKTANYNGKLRTRNSNVIDKVKISASGENIVPTMSEPRTNEAQTACQRGAK